MLASVLVRAQLLVVHVFLRLCWKCLSYGLLRVEGRNSLDLKYMRLCSPLAWSVVMDFSSNELWYCIWEYSLSAWSKIWVIATIARFLMRPLGYTSHLLSVSSWGCTCFHTIHFWSFLWAFSFFNLQSEPLSPHSHLSTPFIVRWVYFF